MQAKQLQRVQKRLRAVRRSLQPLQKRQQEEVLKDEPDKTVLDQLKEDIAPLDAKELQLLRERERLETRPEGEQHGAQRLKHGGRQPTLFRWGCSWLRRGSTAAACPSKHMLSARPCG